MYCLLSYTKKGCILVNIHTNICAFIYNQGVWVPIERETPCVYICFLYILSTISLNCRLCTVKHMTSLNITNIYCSQFVIWKTLSFYIAKRQTFLTWAIGNWNFKKLSKFGFCIPVWFFLGDERIEDFYGT